MKRHILALSAFGALVGCTAPQANFVKCFPNMDAHRECFDEINRDLARERAVAMCVNDSGQRVPCGDLPNNPTLEVGLMEGHEPNNVGAGFTVVDVNQSGDADEGDHVLIDKDRDGLYDAAYDIHGELLDDQETLLKGYNKALK